MTEDRDELLAQLSGLGGRRLAALGFFRPLSFDGVAHGAGQEGPVGLILDQVVLGALLDRPQRRLLVVQAGQHHHGDARSSRSHPRDRVGPLGVR